MQVPALPSTLLIEFGPNGRASLLALRHSKWLLADPSVTHRKLATLSFTSYSFYDAGQVMQVGKEGRERVVEIVETH